jgi:hypothetical protein
MSSNKALKTLTDLHDVVGSALLEAIKSGDIDPRLIKEAREFLKDNNINSNVQDDSNLARLANEEIVLDDDYLQEGGFELVVNG